MNAKTKEKIKKQINELLDKNEIQALVSNEILAEYIVNNLEILIKMRLDSNSPAQEELKEINNALKEKRDEKQK